MNKDAMVLEQWAMDWCEKHFSRQCVGLSSDQLDELVDHIVSAALVNRAEGVSLDDAFSHALKQFGEPDSVSRQLRAGLPLHRRVLAAECGPQHGASPVTSVGIALVFAALILMSAWWLKEARIYDWVFALLILGWFVTSTWLGGSRAVAAAEWRWLKNRFFR
ncbi:MAG: hypothetical protein AAF465_10680 [Pseudomonadota bacterium]